MEMGWWWPNRLQHFPYRIIASIPKNLSDMNSWHLPHPTRASMCRPMHIITLEWEATFSHSNLFRYSLIIIMMMNTKKAAMRILKKSLKKKNSRIATVHLKSTRGYLGSTVITCPLREKSSIMEGESIRIKLSLLSSIAVTSSLSNHRNRIILLWTLNKKWWSPRKWIFCLRMRRVWI